MDTDINKNNASGDELQIHISYIESVLENYKKQLSDIQKNNPDFSKHFIPNGQLDKLQNYLNQIENLEKGVTDLIHKIASEISMMHSYEYVTGMRDCLSGSTPEAIRLLTFLAGKDAYSLEQKLMASMDLKGERLIKATDTYNKERNLLANRAIDKARFLKESELIKIKKNTNSNRKKKPAVKQNNDAASSSLSNSMNAKVGDIITLGKYPQEKDRTVKPIEWRVLVKEGKRILLLSRYALDCKRYNENFADTTWESCTLRMWLNSDFINKAFNEEEMALIPEATVAADKNPEYGTDPGRGTTDKVFLLSIPEVKKYFKNYEDRKCVPTAYAVKQGAWTDVSKKVDGKPTCWWVLRSPGNNGYGAAFVSPGGSVCANGLRVDNDNFGVRPALWINL